MRSKIHQNIYLFSLLALVISIPTSNAGMNLAGACLFANWVLEWNWKEKYNLLKQNKLAIVFAVFWCFLAFSLIQTNNWSTAFQNLAAKTPFFYIPVVLATTPKPNLKWQRFILLAFIITVLISSLLSIIILQVNHISDIRQGGLFISHIRFSICVALSIVFAGHYFFKKDMYPRPVRIGCAIAAFWLFFYLFIIQVLTGIVILLIISIIFAIKFLFSKKNIPYKKAIIASSSVLFVAIIFIITTVIVQYYHYDSTQEARLPLRTEKGNLYEHDTHSIIESGNKTGLYVCKKELEEEWQLRSDSNYYSKEKTLIRYLNSKGLRKDASGVKSLTDDDIKNIEQNIANADYTQKIGLKRVLYPTFFSLSLYKQTHITTNSSLLQRVELWETSLKVCRHHWLTGCGLGNTKNALDIELKKSHSELSGEMGCHNQFLTYTLTGGIVLLLAFIGLLIAPFFDRKRKKSFLYVLFFVALTISFFTEDTLETVAGLNLFLFFNSYFLFCINDGQFE